MRKDIIFDLHETTKKIKVILNHLSQLKIGVMGCVVNVRVKWGMLIMAFCGAGPGG